MAYFTFKNKKTWFNFIANKNSKNFPLVLLHGGLGYSSYYLEPLKSLSKDFPILLYDQRGCGRSDEIDLKEANIKFFVKELEALRKFLDIKKMYLWGHSCGATIALEYYKAYPKRVEKIIFASPFFSTKLWEKDAFNNIETLPENVKKIIFNSLKSKDYFSNEFINATKEYNNNFVFRGPQKPLCLLESDASASSKIYNFIWGISEFCINGILKDFDNSDYLKKIKVPCLFTIGQFDEVSKETIIYYKKKIKSNDDVLIRIYENSSHNSHIENEDNYLKDIELFLNEK